ncbi:MAG: C40 family peptidase [Flavobacteriaceae bacterium]
MKHLLLLITFAICLSSCKSAKSTQYSSTHPRPIKTASIKKKTTVIAPNTPSANTSETTITYKTKAENIIDFAKDFEGVKYKWGGTTKAGMDCSGLVFESFKAYDVLLPRISRDMAKQGEKISLNQVAQGDLLFFITGNRRGTINHVGLVVSTSNNVIEFIHSTTKLGVVVSSLSEDYWNKSFKEARKIL